VACGNDLDASLGAVTYGQTGREGQPRDAEGAIAGRVEEGLGEGVVEVADIRADAEADEDVRPVVVEVELDGAAGQGPVGAVTAFREAGEVTRNASAGVYPLGKVCLTAEGGGSPCRVLNAKVGDGELRRSEEDSGGQHCNGGRGITAAEEGGGGAFRAGTGWW